MKPIYLFLCLFSLVALMPQAASAGGCYVDPVLQYSGTGRIVSSANLRSEACTKGTVVLRTLGAGVSVNVVGYTDGWYEVIAGSRRGWVAEQFIQVDASPTGISYANYEAYRLDLSGSPTEPTTVSAPLTPSITQTSSVAGETAYTGAIDARSLIKLVCPSVAGADHPCRAVYYVGAGGKRHAFPNSRVFATWYENFDQVKAVTQERLGQYMLGQNVTYRPGSKMVKFTTDPKVYAVGRGGVLRWVKSEEAAIALYGADWNKNVDDIPDAFYLNYTFGTDIASATDFSPIDEMTLTPTFD